MGLVFVMAFIHCRTFLFCLHLRAGVWILALLALLLGGAGATGGWMEVKMTGIYAQQTRPLPVY